MHDNSINQIKANDNGNHAAQFESPDETLLKLHEHVEQSDSLEQVLGRELSSIHKIKSKERLLGEIQDLSSSYIIDAMNAQGKQRFIEPPWLASNQLYVALGEYRGAQLASETVEAIMDFFDGIEAGKPSDINGDGHLSYQDVLAIANGSKVSPQPPIEPPLPPMPPDPAGDIKEFSKLLLEDPDKNLGLVKKLAHKLAAHTGIGVDLARIDRLYSFFLREKSDLTKDGHIDHQDVIAFWRDPKPKPPADPWKTIVELSKPLLENPLDNLLLVPKLAKSLEAVTGVEDDLGKQDALMRFVLRGQHDITGDGVINHSDIVEFWKQLDGLIIDPPAPPPEDPRDPRFLPL